MRDSMLYTVDRFWRDARLPPSLLRMRDAYYASVYVSTAMRLFDADDCELATADLDRAFSLDPRLLKCGGERFYGHVVDWAKHPSRENPGAFVATVLDHLPDSGRTVCGTTPGDPG